MTDRPRTAKRPRTEKGMLSSSSNASSSSLQGSKKGEREENSVTMLAQLLLDGRWQDAVDRVQSHPHEAAVVETVNASGSHTALVAPSDESSVSSPLAIACRMGAPPKCIQALLSVAPELVRHVVDARGTPLHEAILCEGTGVDVIAALLAADEQLTQQLPEKEDQVEAASETVRVEKTRATLLQDVDGFTPLHLLIRRRFQFQIMQPDEDTGVMRILEMLVESCPEAVVIPDRGEYEEPPIIYALKAEMYAPLIGPEDETIAHVERQIYEMVHCMLRFCPQAASRIFTGYRGQYTALHSAVFHGRSERTIELLLQTEEAQRNLGPPQANSRPKSALLGNTQGEMPLHFCTMRGECPRSVALLSQAAPEAVLKRDASGLTPFHWLCVRFVGSMLAVGDGGRGSDSTIRLGPSDPTFLSTEQNEYNEFTWLSQGDFDRDLHLILRMDPPVDFLRMRHIPSEIHEEREFPSWWSVRSVSILQRIRERYQILKQNDDQRYIEWTREQVVTSLFWTKVVSLIDAARKVCDDRPIGSNTFVHTAFASPCCVPAVAHIAASLFPDELSKPDERGRLPVHYAAARRWMAWDWPRGDGLSESTAAKLLQEESLKMLQVAIALSSSEAFHIEDDSGRFVIHHVVDRFVEACCRPALLTVSPTKGMMKVLDSLVKLNPDSLSRPDGHTGLVPFLQATAAASARKGQSRVQSELPLSITFQLLRSNPAVLSSITQ